jgi:V/A-type H+-transporting ATPase subunit K
MELSVLAQIGVGGSFGFAALGGAIGFGVAGPAVIGAWKKCYVQNKPAPFILMVFAGVVLSNVIYGFITMNSLMGSTLLSPEQFFSLGAFAGIALGVSAITQGMAAAGAADALGETGKGFANYLMVIGIGETVALFTMVFTIMNA